MTATPDGAGRADPGLDDRAAASEPVRKGPGVAGTGVSTVTVRVTGLFLGLLLPLHVAMVLVVGDVGRATWVSVSDRLAVWWWPGVEWATLVLALVHGVAVVRDRVRRSGRAGTAAEALVVATALAALAVGAAVTWTLVTFS